jgi:lysophospholipid acyltransferase (LPLAT)-like uncharacterized protein
MKKILKVLRQQLVLLAPAFIKLWAATWRIHVHGKLPEPGDTGVLACWHGELMVCIKSLQQRDVAALASLSRDGDLISSLLESWGFHMVRGSSSKGAARALAEMIAVAKQRCVALTPDGPRGPARQMKNGAVAIASRAAVPLYLYTARSRWAIRGTSWDRFLLPLPFARVDITIRQLPIPDNADREQIEVLNQRAEAILNGAVY